MDEKNEKSNPSFMIKDFLVGYVASACGNLSGQPFDTIKVRMATYHKKTNMFRTGVNIVKNEGVYGLYKGSLAPTIGTGIFDSILFGVYSSSLRFFEKKLGVKHLPLRFHFLSGMCGAFVSNFIVVPFELVKIQLQVQETRRLSNFHCIRNIIQSKGFLGLYQGYLATLIRDLPSIGIWLSSYQGYKRVLGHHDSSWNHFISGGLAGATCWMAIYPFDVIKSKLQSLPPYPERGWNQYEGILDCVQKTYKNHGIRGFTKGMGACLSRGVPVNAFTFLIYEAMKKLLFKKDKDRILE